MVNLKRSICWLMEIQKNNEESRRHLFSMATLEERIYLGYKTTLKRLFDLRGSSQSERLLESFEFDPYKNKNGWWWKICPMPSKRHKSLLNMKFECLPCIFSSKFSILCQSKKVSPLFVISAFPTQNHLPNPCLQHWLPRLNPFGAAEVCNLHLVILQCCFKKVMS